MKAIPKLGAEKNSSELTDKFCFYTSGSVLCNLM